MRWCLSSQPRAHVAEYVQMIKNFQVIGIWKVRCRQGRPLQTSKGVFLTVNSNDKRFTGPNDISLSEKFADKLEFKAL